MCVWGGEGVPVGVWGRGVGCVCGGGVGVPVGVGCVYEGGCTSRCVGILNICIFVVGVI